MAYFCHAEDRSENISAEVFQYSNSVAGNDMVTRNGLKSMMFLRKGPGNTFFRKRSSPEFLRNLHGFCNHY
jgi:hypothetical protein